MATLFKILFTKISIYFYYSFNVLWFEFKFEIKWIFKLLKFLLFKSNKSLYIYSDNSRDGAKIIPFTPYYSYLGFY